MTLKYTADQVHTRELAAVGVKGIPNPWWPLAGGNDCLAFQLYVMGVRARTDLALKYISIAEFRYQFSWPEIPMELVKPGDLVCEMWPDNGDPITSTPNHIEYVVAIDRAGKTITTISANTGPHPGVSDPRGAYRKTRTLTGNFLFGVRPPYKGASSSRVNEVKVVAAYLNKQKLGKTTAAVDDGDAGPVYWWLVQTWGRAHKLYGPLFHIDGDPGPQSRAVEAAIYKLARKG
jgi:hypothetical protein